MNKVMPIRAINDLQPITIENEELEDVNQFSNLGSQIDSEERSTVDIKVVALADHNSHLTS